MVVIISPNKRLHWMLPLFLNSGFVLASKSCLIS